jgi:rubredoxin
MAFLVEHDADVVIGTHFHQTDQFQVVTSGGGQLGKHELGMLSVHFARAYTPYGPIKAAEQGLSYLTLRARWDPGSQHLPESRPLLEQVPNRRPWQMTETPDLNLKASSSGVAVEAMAQLTDQHGLACYYVVMRSGKAAEMPRLPNSDGQFVIIVKGGIINEGRTTKGMTIAWVDKDEPPLQLHAGADGCAALVLNYPTPNSSSAEKVSQAPKEAVLYSYQCTLCGFVYDEAKGMPERGIAPGTRWDDLPDDFTCPDCTATKADFQRLDA